MPAGALLGLAASALSRRSPASPRRASVRRLSSGRRNATSSTRSSRWLICPTPSDPATVRRSRKRRRRTAVWRIPQRRVELGDLRQGVLLDQAVALLASLPPCPDSGCPARRPPSLSLLGLEPLLELFSSRPCGARRGRSASAWLALMLSLGGTQLPAVPLRRLLPGLLYACAVLSAAPLVTATTGALRSDSDPRPAVGRSPTPVPSRRVMRQSGSPLGSAFGPDAFGGVPSPRLWREKVLTVVPSMGRPERQCTCCGALLDHVTGAGMSSDDMVPPSRGLLRSGRCRRSSAPDQPGPGAGDDLAVRQQVCADLDDPLAAALLDSGLLPPEPRPEAGRGLRAAGRRSPARCAARRRPVSQRSAAGRPASRPASTTPNGAREPTRSPQSARKRAAQAAGQDEAGAALLERVPEHHERQRHERLNSVIGSIAAFLSGRAGCGRGRLSSVLQA